MEEVEVMSKKFYDEVNEELRNIEALLDVLNSKIKSLEIRIPSRVKLIDNIDVVKKGIVILDVFAKWCVPCYKIHPALEQVAKELEESGQDKKFNIHFYRIDIDEHPELKEIIKRDLGIEQIHIPLIILYKDGKILQKLEGSPREKRTDIIRWMVWRALVPEEEWNKTYKFVERTAQRMGWYLNPHRFMVEGLVSALTYNKLNYGYYYCPCKPQHVPENICPCRPFGKFVGSKKRIETEGICYCGLFVSKEYIEEWNRLMEERKAEAVATK